MRTTPESSDLQALFREMVDAGCRRAVLEVSSHSLVLERVHGLEFQVAVFTNLTRDHLDFHGDMDAYFAAKRLLFERAPARGRPRDREPRRRPRGRARPREPRDRSGPTRVEKPAADLLAEDVRLSLDGTRFRARTPAGAARDRDAAPRPLQRPERARRARRGRSPSACRPTPCSAGSRRCAACPGAWSASTPGQAFTVLVDYAHTDDALKNLLETVRGLKPRRVITVFGCGGDRDRTKRPLMGAVAARLSDVVVLTSDNPRSEPPEAILEEIRRGIPAARAARHARRSPDRREAIARALEMGREGVVVVIAGKGHETYQVLRDRTVPFDDRQVAREVLARLAGAGGRR